MQEMGACIDQNVRGKLNGMFEMFRVDIGGLVTNSQETQRELEQGIRAVSNAMDGRLIDNNQRNNNQESSLKELGGAIMGLREDMGESRNNTQQIQEKQRK